MSYNIRFRRLFGAGYHLGITRRKGKTQLIQCSEPTVLSLKVAFEEVANVSIPIYVILAFARDGA
jgi:hypothetical protein